MQVQAKVTDTSAQTLSSATSLRCVETLLKAGLGCIAYLRGLLPYENFSEYHLSAQLPSVLSTGSFDNQTRPSGVTIMSLKRGFTNEGDRILDYLEKGIFDAIEKQYLRRLIFAIYLDSKDPNNIVEAYTFNFQYYKVAGTDTAVPIMFLGDQLSRISLHPMDDGDPVVGALKQGKSPTLGDVKRSLKLMIKTLVTAISQMEALPRCRYGNFKLFFNENTPDDYQPPHFRAGDADSNKWFFTTHKAAEVPESTRIGSLETGWHGVNMKVVSVSSFLPSSTEDNDATFTGLTTRCPPKLSPIEEARLRVRDAELQKNDALKRDIMWNADSDTEDDAPGEDISEDVVILAKYNTNNAVVPIGLRGDKGKILPIPIHEVRGGCDNMIEYSGYPDPTPMHVGHLFEQMVTSDMGETQVIPATQEIDMQSPSPPQSMPCVSSLPSSDIRDSSGSFISAQQINTCILREKLRKSTDVALDVEGQILVGQISSEQKKGGTDTEGVDCDCGFDQADNSLILCESGCNRWRHIWCMGYHGPDDKRLPSAFICFDCRLRPEWDIIGEKRHVDMISRFKDLALFRRAIKVFEVYKPTTAIQFREQIGCPATVVNQLLMRLEDEGFITTENALSAGLGSLRGHAKKCKKQTRNKGKKTHKELHKTNYVFLNSSKKSKAYHDYFNAEPLVEDRLLGIADRVTGSHLRDERIGKSLANLYQSTGQNGGSSNEMLEFDSQTQEPTQNILTLAYAHSQPEASLKRKAVDDSNKIDKRMKISIGMAVDLCD